MFQFDVEISGSSLVSYFSPRQLRTVCEVLGGLMSPHLQDTRFDNFSYLLERENLNYLMSTCFSIRFQQYV